MEGGTMKQFMKRLFKNEQRIMTLFLILLLFGSHAMAKQITLNFAWTPNTEGDMDRYHLMARQAGQQYDYDTPDDIVPCTIISGDCIPAEGSITFNAPDGVISTWQFVGRAVDTSDKQSLDSNEVNKVIDLTVFPMPTSFVGSYNPTTEMVDLTWSQAQVSRTKKWVISYGDTQGGPYSETYEVDYTGQTSYNASIPIQVPPDVIVTRYFVVKGIAEWDIESVISAEVGVDIYKDTAPAAMIDLHFEVIEIE